MLLVSAYMLMCEAARCPESGRATLRKFFFVCRAPLLSCGVMYIDQDKQSTATIGAPRPQPSLRMDAAAVITFCAAPVSASTTG